MTMVDMNSRTPLEPGNRPKVRRLGMPWYGIFGLALLAAPRAVLHDLQVIEEGTALNAVLVFVPPVIWVVTALALNVRRPVLTLTAVGAAYGIILALVHLILWNVNLGPDRSEERRVGKERRHWLSQQHHKQRCA